MPYVWGPGTRKDDAHSFRHKQTRLICGALNIASCMKSAEYGDHAAVQSVGTDVLSYIPEHDVLLYICVSILVFLKNAHAYVHTFVCRYDLAGTGVWFDVH